MVEREGFAFPMEVEYEWLPELCSHCHILGHSVTNCRWLLSEKDLNLHRDNTKKVHDKGKKAITQQKAQTKKWQAHENPLGIGSFVAFEKLVINSKVTALAVSLKQSHEHHVGSSLAFAKPTSEITAPVVATDQPPEQQVSPTVVALVDTYVAQSETCPEVLPLDSSRHAHSDKTDFTYHLALENVTDDIIRSNDVESTTVLEPVLQLQHVHVPLTVDVHQLKEGSAQVDSGALVVAAAGNSHVIQSHPFAIVIPHRCPIITNDLEVIQQALVVYKDVDKEGLLMLFPGASGRNKKVIKLALMVRYQNHLNEDFILEYSRYR